MKMINTYIVSILFQFDGSQTGAVKLAFKNRLEANDIFNRAHGFALKNAIKDEQSEPFMLMADHDIGRVSLPANSIRGVFMDIHSEPAMGTELPGIPGSQRLG